MKGKQQIERKARLTTQQIDFCMLHIIRTPELFAYAKQHLRAIDFSQTTELHYSIVWAAALTAAERSNGVMPFQGAELIMAMEVLSRIDNASNQVTKAVSDLAVGLVAWIYQFTDDQLNPGYYKELVQDLIIERTVIGEMAKELTLAKDIGRPVDVAESLGKYSQKLQSVLIDSSKAGKTAFPDNFKPKKLGKMSTGVPWLDGFMNGGQAGGEVYTLLGPTGLGKTTTGVMLCTSSARVWNAAYFRGELPKRKISCMFSWEQDIERLMLRFWSYAAQIDSSRLELYADEVVKLSTRGKPEPYELKEFEEAIRTEGIDNWDCEYERLSAASRELKDIVRIFDFSGADEKNSKQGEGGLDEVAASLNNLVNEGFEIGTVVLDYAGAAVRRQMSAKNEDPDRIRHRLANFCNEARFKIALPFNCPVWAFHQLNTEANRRTPTAKQHHSYASECGNFSENAWFAFVFGTKDESNNITSLHCSKERRARGGKADVILRIEGNYCRMSDVSDKFTHDTGIHRFVPKDHAARRVSPNDLRVRQEQMRPGSTGLAEY